MDPATHDLRTPAPAGLPIGRHTGGRGLAPPATALLVVLGMITAGRPAGGVALVAAFGVGMAAVMAGIAVAWVHAR